MEPKETSSHPFDELVQNPEGVEITAAVLQLLKDFNTVPVGTRFTVRASTLPEFNISVTECGLLIEIHHRITLPQGLLKYPVLAIYNALIRATRLVPKHSEPNDPPEVSSASGNLSGEVSWSIELPLETSGEKLIEAVRASNAFVWMHAEGILNFKPSR